MGTKAGRGDVVAATSVRVEQTRPHGRETVARPGQAEAAANLARWIKITTPNDRRHVIRVLETAAGILRDELEAGCNAGPLGAALGLVDGSAP